MNIIQTAEELQTLYGEPGEASLVKEVDHIIPEYAAVIEASPFAVLATVGEGGVDCSPRGDIPGFVRVADERTLMLPDRRGNNRIDSLSNIVADGRVALLFLVPGSGTTLRVNGRAEISVDSDLLDSFAVGGKAPRSVTVIQVETVFFQCARAIHRSRIWDEDAKIDPKTLPTPGRMLASASEGQVGGDAYDVEWPERAKKSMW